MPEYGFTYKGRHSRDLGLMGVNVDPPILPPLEQKLVSVPGRAGSYRTRQQFGNRSIPVRFSYRGTSLADLRNKARDIAAWLTPADTEAGVLIFDDEPGRQYFAWLDGSVEPTETWLIGQADVTFLCADPFAYALADTAQAIQNVIAGGVARITVGGSWKVFPRLDITFGAASQDFTVRNTAGEFVTVRGAFNAGDMLTLDLADGTLIINGVNSPARLDMRSTFFALLPGDNDLTFTPAAGFTGTVTWRERWL